MVNFGLAEHLAQLAVVVSGDFALCHPKIAMQESVQNIFSEMVMNFKDDTPRDANEELLKIASGATALGVTGRDESGRLKDWNKWAAAHPQRALNVTVHKGRSEWRHRSKSISQQKLSLMSWNTLVSHPALSRTHSDSWFAHA